MDKALDAPEFTYGVRTAPPPTGYSLAGGGAENPVGFLSKKACTFLPCLAIQRPADRAQSDEAQSVGGVAKLRRGEVRSARVERAVAGRLARRCGLQHAARW